MASHVFMFNTLAHLLTCCCCPQEESSLLVASAAKFNNWFNVKVQENTEVVAIDRAARTITARGPGGEERHE